MVHPKPQKGKMASVWEKIKNFFKKKEVKHIHLDPDSVKKYHQVKTLANENALLKGELAKLKVEKIKERQREEQKQEDEEIKLELNRQKKRIEEKKYPKYFSFKTFFNKLRVNKKFREKLGFYSFDSAKKLSNFVDIGLTEDGDIALIGKDNEVLLKGRSPKELFWSVGGLGIDISANKIPICVNKEGKYQENVMVWEPARIIPTIEGKFEYSHSSKKPLYDYLAEINQENSDLRHEIERKDLALTELHNKRDELEIASKTNLNSAETSRKELSMAGEKTSEIERAFRGLANELAKVRDTNTVFEENLEKLEKQFDKMRNEAERQGVKLSDKVAMELIQQIRRELVKDEPEKAHISENPISQPQNSLGKPNK